VGRSSALFFPISGGTSGIFSKCKSHRAEQSRTVSIHKWRYGTTSRYGKYGDGGEEDAEYEHEEETDEDTEGEAKEEAEAAKDADDDVEPFITRQQVICFPCL
jgi:hypothetical protein